MHACIIDCIVATPQATNGIISSFLLFPNCLFLVAPIYAPAYPFRVLHTRHLFLSYLWSLLLFYLAALLIDRVTFADRLPLIVCKPRLLPLVYS